MCDRNFPWSEGPSHISNCRLSGPRSWETQLKACGLHSHRMLVPLLAGNEKECNWTGAWGRCLYEHGNTSIVHLMCISSSLMDKLKRHALEICKSMSSSCVTTGCWFWYRRWSWSIIPCIYPCAIVFCKGPLYVDQVTAWATDWAGGKYVEDISLNCSLGFDNASHEVAREKTGACRHAYDTMRFLTNINGFMCMDHLLVASAADIPQFLIMSSKAVSNGCV